MTSRRWASVLESASPFGKCRGSLHRPQLGPALQASGHRSGRSGRLRSGLEARRRRPKVADSAVFTPQVDLVVGMNDMVHVQWTGNDNTNNNGDNNGEGTNNEDRHNIVQRGSLDHAASPTQ